MGLAEPMLNYWPTWSLNFIAFAPMCDIQQNVTYPMDILFGLISNCGMKHSSFMKMYQALVSRLQKYLGDPLPGTPKLAYN